MIKSKFKKGEIAIYQNGENFEIGEVTEIFNCFDHFEYSLRYHKGDTTARTHEIDLHKIKNNYAFQIIRKDTNNCINTQKARQMACKIIEEVVEPTALKNLTHELYFLAEDDITKIIEEFQEKPYERRKFMKECVTVNARGFNAITTDFAVVTDAKEKEKLINLIFKISSTWDKEHLTAETTADDRINYILEEIKTHEEYEIIEGPTRLNL